MATRMQQRRGTAAQWTAANPILAAGEIGFETDTNKFKMGNGTSTWTALQYFANAAELAAIIDGAPELLNTLNELAASIGDDPNFLTNYATITATTAAIADSRATSALDATSKANGAIAAAALDATSKANAAQAAAALDAIAKANAATDAAVAAAALDATSKANAVADAASSALGTHVTDETNVHGIADTAALATKTYADTAATAAAVLAVSEVTTGTIGLGNVDNTSDANKPVSTAQATAIADAVSDHNLEETNVHGIADTAELVTQTQLTNAISGAEVDQAALAGVGLEWNAATDKFDVKSTHITTATQTELDLKAPKADPTFTGTVSGVTKTHVGLANVDNTSDANKPVSTATQTALDLKANLAAPTFTGTVVLPSTTSIGNVSATELGYVDGVTSSIQTQLTARLPLAGGTMTGALTLSGAPTSDLHAATKLYVDNVTAGINFHESVHVASTVNSAVIYNNGTNGVGATLTADTNRAISTLDGESVALGERILMKNQTDAKQNGIYVLTTVGSASAPWVMTRATDADNNPTGEMKSGDFTFVQRGTVNGSVGYINNSTANPIVIGTDNISYTEFNAAKAVSAGSGLTEATPGTISIATGGVTSAMIADGAIVDADVNASAAIAQSKISGLTSDLAAKAPTANPTFTGTVTVAAAGVAFTDGTQTKAGVPSITNIPTAIAAGAHSLAAGRADQFIPLTGAVVITLPATGYSTGQSIDFYQESGTGASFASTNGVVGTPGRNFRTTNSVVTAMKTAAGWLVFGDLSA